MHDGVLPPSETTAPELAAETADGAMVRRVRRNLVLWSGGTTLLILVALAVALYLAAASSLASAGIAQLDSRMGIIRGERPDPDDDTRYGYIFGSGCGRAGHPTSAHVHQYVRLGDQAWGNGNWDPSGAWDDRYPTAQLNSRTVSIEHHDNGGRTAGSGKGVVPEAVITASIALDALLLRGDPGELTATGIRFRAGTETAFSRELRAIPIDAHHLIDHHYIAGRLKPSCWRPWADDPVGFRQARYLAALAPAPLAPEETVNSYPVPKVPSIATVPAGTWLYATSELEPSPDNIRVDPGRDMPYLGQPASTVRIVEYVDATGVHQGRSMFAKASELTTIRPAPDPTPFSQAQLDAAQKLAAAAVKTAADRAAAAYGA